MSSGSFVPPRLQDDRLAFDISEIEKSLSKRIEVLKRGAAGCKDTDSRYLPSLLGPGGERRGDDAASEHRHEGAPLHHRIISSARSRSDCGIVRPSAFAVLRLITNSNLVGCSTGKSAGLAPLRILST